MVNEITAAATAVIDKSTAQSAVVVVVVQKQEQWGEHSLLHQVRVSIRTEASAPIP